MRVNLTIPQDALERFEVAHKVALANLREAIRDASRKQMLLMAKDVRSKLQDNAMAMTKKRLRACVECSH